MWVPVAVKRVANCYNPFTLLTLSLRVAYVCPWLLSQNSGVEIKRAVLPLARHWNVLMCRQATAHSLGLGPGLDGGRGFQFRFCCNDGAIANCLLFAFGSSYDARCAKQRLLCDLLSLFGDVLQMISCSQLSFGTIGGTLIISVAEKPPLSINISHSLTLPHSFCSRLAVSVSRRNL